MSFVFKTLNFILSINIHLELKLALFVKQGYDFKQQTARSQQFSELTETRYAPKMNPIIAAS